MAVINLLAASTVRGEDVTREDILWAIDIASRTADELDDGATETPSDEDVHNTIKAAFDILNGNKATKSTLTNAVMLKGRYKRMIADYIVSRAETLHIIKSTPRGNCIDYSLA